MKVWKGMRALLAVVLAALMVITFMPAMTYTSLAASKVTKVTKANYKKNKSYAKSVGTAVTLKYKLSPSRLTSNAKKVTWRSNNSDIAEISGAKSGSAKVTFKAAGSVKVTVKSRQNSRAKVTWKFRVLTKNESTPLTSASIAAKDTNQDVTKSVRVGNTLRASVTPAGATAAYQWYADGQPIDGATGARYNPSRSNLGKTLTVRATGTGLYSGTVESKATAAVTAKSSGGSGSSSEPTNTVIDNSPKNELPTLYVVNLGTLSAYFNLETFPDDSYEIEWHFDDGKVPSSSNKLDVTEDMEDYEADSADHEYDVPTLSYKDTHVFGEQKIYAVAYGKLGADGVDYTGSTSVSKEITIAPDDSTQIGFTLSLDGAEQDLQQNGLPVGSKYTLTADNAILSDTSLTEGKDYTIRWYVVKMSVSSPSTSEEIVQEGGKTFNASKLSSFSDDQIELLYMSITGINDYSGTIVSSQVPLTNYGPNSITDAGYSLKLAYDADGTRFPPSNDLSNTASSPLYAVIGKYDQTTQSGTLLKYGTNYTTEWFVRHSSGSIESLGESQSFIIKTAAEAGKLIVGDQIYAIATGLNDGTTDYSDAKLKSDTYNIVPQSIYS